MYVMTSKYQSFQFSDSRIRICPWIPEYHLSRQILFKCLFQNEFLLRMATNSQECVSFEKKSSTVLFEKEHIPDPFSLIIVKKFNLKGTLKLSKYGY